MDAQLKALLDQYGVATSNLTNAAVKELAALWASLPRNDFELVRAILIDRYYEIAVRYGFMSAELSATVYEVARNMSGRIDTYKAFVPPAYATVKLAKHVDFAVGTLYNTRDFDKALSNLSGDLVKYTMDSGREATHLNLLEDAKQTGRKALWSIVPEAGACAYCVKLGNSFRYRSAHTARATFHSNCRCDVVPEF